MDRSEIDAPQRFGTHRNAFGFLRLLFASLVIVSHTPELVDGNRHRELLTRVFGSISFGEFAVAGFFVISGYLIAGSYAASRSVGAYLLKRIARIYPAFAVASLAAVFVVGPLAGGIFYGSPLRILPGTGFRIVTLARPCLPGAFAAQGWDACSGLDGAMWTIQYEFACYLVVILLGLTTMLRRPAPLAVLSAALLALAATLPTGALPWLSHAWLWAGPPAAWLRMVGMFLAGSAYRALGGRLPTGGWWMVAAALGLLLGLHVPAAADACVALFGGYLIVAGAHAAPRLLCRINDRSDISYGLYLYAWPVELLLIRWGWGGSLFALGVAVWLAAAALGWLSWHGVERPAMEWVRARPRRPAATPATAQR